MKLEWTDIQNDGTPLLATRLVEPHRPLVQEVRPTPQAAVREEDSPGG
jgi:hypothetical protein